MVKEIYTREVIPIKNIDDKGFIYNISHRANERGAKVLGAGLHGIVLSHPKWNFVFKIFPKDIPYLKFVRYAIKHPSSVFPIFYDIPRKIKTSNKVYNNWYGVKLELLKPITMAEFEPIEEFILNYAEFTSKAKKSKLQNLKKKYPNIENFYKMFYKLMKLSSKSPRFGAIDFHEENIMIRNNSELVLVDPFHSTDVNLTSIIYN